MHQHSDPYLGVGIPLLLLGLVVAWVIPAREQFQALIESVLAAATAAAAAGVVAPTGAPPGAARTAPLTLLQLVRRVPVWTNNAHMFVVVVCITYWENFGSVYLHDTLGLPESAIFWVFCGVAVVYVVAALAAGALEPRLGHWPRVSLTACTLLVAFGALVVVLGDPAAVGAGAAAPAPAPATSPPSGPLAAAVVSYAIIAVACAASVVLVLPFSVVAVGHQVRVSLGRAWWVRARTKCGCDGVDLD
jgi:hypothetical protein